MERAPRDLADTQFRFEAREDGAETIRSVDHPDRFVRVDGTQVRLDATATAFRRITTRNTIKIQADDGSYLRVAGARVTTGAEGTAFRLS